MIGCAFLNDISEALSVAKGNTDAFGGINIIFAGDFAQLPPVGQKRLYANIIQPGALYNADTRPKQNVVFGKLLWLSVKTVVLLTENKRQSGPENARFLALLGRLREGRCTHSDYALLNSRILSNMNINWMDDRWRRAPMLVVRCTARCPCSIRNWVIWKLYPKTYFSLHCGA
ncbi:hypothetical protein B0H19DRAFT_963966 [Mycena capillaripes]|nr:hypothetical protein B0H19DRAFT_963966 [Mycena capillaripes]